MPAIRSDSLQRLMAGTRLATTRRQRSEKCAIGVTPAAALPALRGPDQSGHRNQTESALRRTQLRYITVRIQRLEIRRP